MANYSDKQSKNKKKDEARDIALDKLDFYEAPHKKKSGKKGDKIKGRPQGGWAKFCYAAFPQAEDTGGEKVRKVVLIAAVIMFAVTLAVLLSQLVGIEKGSKTNSNIAEIAGVHNGTIDVDLSRDPFATHMTGGSDAVIETEEVIDVTPIKNVPIQADFNSLIAINPDTRGWIQIMGTYVNNPVVQAADDEYYLDHDFNKNTSISGTVFSNHKNRWDGTDENLILYGHNMINGEFFASITHYLPNDASKEPLAFYKVHPTVMLATPGEGCQVYKIFAGILANTQEEYGEVFEYAQKTSFSGTDDFNNFIIDIMDMSWFFTDVDLQYGDQLLTMSTCCWPLGKNVDTRWVLFARKVRPGESEDVDTTVAERNYNAKLFDYYYRQIGGQWYGSTWDRSKLLSY